VAHFIEGSAFELLCR